MAMDQSLLVPEHFESDGGVSLKQKLKSSSAQTTIYESDTGCFECNICFESAHEPVVTFCGHLYCWPCIYKWIHVERPNESDQLPKCPVCKASISTASLVPLYGRGTSSSDSEVKKERNLGMVVPRRPSPCGLSPLINSTAASMSHPGEQFPSNYFQAHSRPFHRQQHLPPFYGSHSSNAAPSPHLGSTNMTSYYNPTIGMFGEMVFARMFGTSYTNLHSFPYSNYYYALDGSSSPRIRRQEMQLDKSLNRVSIFLLCCLILCLLLF